MQRSTQRENVTDWFLVPSLLRCCHPQRTSQALPVREHSALILEPEKDSRGVQLAAFNVRPVVPYLDYYHRIPIHYGNAISSGTYVFGIYQHVIPKRSKRKKFCSSRKFLVNFQRKRVERSIICECNLKIVKICQQCANFESGSLSEKLLRIEKVAQNRTSC